MCRLFAYSADTKTSPEYFLETAHNSLKHQAKKNPDGWGLSYYDNNHELHVFKAPYSAENSSNFAEISHLIKAKVFLSHIREASTGNPIIENCHPFHHNGFVMAHNGLMPEFNIMNVRNDVMNNITRKWRKEIKGETDSEAIFYLIMSKIKNDRSVGKIKVAIKNALYSLEKIYYSDVPTSDSPIFNLILTDGDDMYITRRGRPLYLMGISKTSEPDKLQKWNKTTWQFGKHVNYSQVYITSETFGEHENWFEIPENSLVHIDKKQNFSIEHLKMRL